MEPLHTTRWNWYADGRSARWICVARAEFVRQFIAPSEFEGLFGGYLLAADSSGQEFLGVWSGRMGSRFRRLLRERDAVFVVTAATVKESLTVQAEGGREVRRTIQLYNLDLILTLGAGCSQWSRLSAHLQAIGRPVRGHLRAWLHISNQGGQPDREGRPRAWPLAAAIDRAAVKFH